MRMISKFILVIPVFVAMASCAPAATENAETPAPITDEYNAELAEKLGADDYGMRSYVFTVLKTGPAEITDETERAEIFKGHFANMGRLASEGKLVLAGPFMDGGDKRGMYIFNVTTIEDAEALVATDPAVAAGIFVPEFTKYYGSAALMQISDVHSTIQKTKIE